MLIQIKNINADAKDSIVNHISKYSETNASNIKLIIFTIIHA